MGYTIRDKRYMNLAKQVAKLSDFHRCKIGCIVVYRKCILATGFNSEKTHTLQGIYNSNRSSDSKSWSSHKVHAEIAALSKIQYLDVNWSAVKIYIYRIKNNFSYGIARPCPACMKFIKELGIKKVYYSTNESMIFEEIF